MPRPYESTLETDVQRPWPTGSPELIKAPIAEATM